MELEFINELLILLGVHLLALASPGPDFVVVLRSSLSGQIKRTIICCIGIALGVATHLLMAYLGLSIILKESKLLYSIIVIMGCLWLLYMGVTGLRSQGGDFKNQPRIHFNSHLKAFRNGYLTNLLNPKALVYFISVISPWVRPGDNDALFISVWVCFTLLTFIWFATLAVTLNLPTIKNLFNRYSKYIDQFFSVVIIGLAIYFMYSEFTNILF